MLGGSLKERSKFSVLRPWVQALALATRKSVINILILSTMRASACFLHRKGVWTVGGVAGTHPTLSILKPHVLWGGPGLFQGTKRLGDTVLPPALQEQNSAAQPRHPKFLLQDWETESRAEQGEAISRKVTLRPAPRALGCPHPLHPLQG